MNEIKQQLKGLRNQIDSALEQLEQETQGSGEDGQNWSDELKDNVSDLQNKAQNTFNNLRAKIDPNYSEAQAKVNNVKTDAQNQVDKLTN